jgi:hypothetical protein
VDGIGGQASASSAQARAVIEPVLHRGIDRCGGGLGARRLQTGGAAEQAGAGEQQVDAEREQGGGGTGRS